ncbi:MAG: hypothetical protein E5Y89_02450 [Mesorhizobium sp.]|nr:MAG: hypothetical protein E5Y89_02450 [Mesorhizobium sp.]
MRLVDGEPQVHAAPVKGQLSLFDFRPVARVICLPMMELHGAAFVRALEGLKPRVLFDLRRAPFFEITGISREWALNVIHQNVSTHQRFPLDLRVGVPSVNRWELVTQVANFSRALAEEIKHGPLSAVLLMNHSDSLEFFAGMVPPSTELSFSWRFEAPNGEVIRLC